MSGSFIGYKERLIGSNLPPKISLFTTHFVPWSDLRGSPKIMLNSKFIVKSVYDPNGNDNSSSAGTL